MANNKIFQDISEAARWILSQIQGPIVMATPLGLGKPNQLINAVYNSVKSDSSKKLKIFTALSLAKPSASNELQKRFLLPFAERQWGADYPELEYVKDALACKLPVNIRVHEFYFQAGKYLNSADMQRDYISVNYTHVPYAIVEQKVNVLVQLVAKKSDGFYSLSSNPDLTLDVVELYKKLDRKLLVVGVVHPDLPYCGADAEVKADFFDAIVESPEVTHKLFALPREPISDEDFMIGLYASTLIEDGGTLQIGIGSLSDALVYCTLLRHQQNALYKTLVKKLFSLRPNAAYAEHTHTDVFTKGLYGTSEMLMDGFMHLHRAGILKRTVLDQNSIPRYLHGAFYLGSNEFYQWLRDLDSAGDTGMCMTRVSKVNDLYDSDELALRRQRVKARFFNSCMSVSLLGGVASDTREDGKTVSGIGGQYNFVAMSHELPDSHSILMLRSTRYNGPRFCSNIVWSHGQQSIPRHLRDIVISEYGIAFLKNRTDEDVIKATLSISNKNFLSQLQQQAVQNLKLSAEWQLPDYCKNNDEDFAREFLAEWKAQGLFQAFPFGSDFTKVEERLALALTTLKDTARSKTGLAKLFFKGLNVNPTTADCEALQRMQLSRSNTVKEWFYRKLILGVLAEK